MALNKLQETKVTIIDNIIAFTNRLVQQYCKFSLLWLNKLQAILIMYYVNVLKTENSMDMVIAAFSMNFAML